MSALDWRDDVLGAPYQAATIPLRPDAEGEAVATLVRRVSATPGNSADRRAVLHVHGFADYFFQTVAADYWVDRGYDFYALDLRKYGRSMRPHQTPNYVADLRAYDEEIDRAWAEVTAEHDHVVLTAHSTGGLTLPLWAHGRRGSIPQLRGVVLNAPWLDMHGDLLTRLVAMPVLHRLGARQPTREIPRKVDGLYARSLHRDHEGEWDFDLAWKPLRSWPVYAGWIRAIRTGHARVAAGLEVPAPLLVLSSARSSLPTSIDDPDLFTTDVVLDVEQIRRRAPLLGRHVTLAQIEGATHDVTLSPEPVRTQVFAEIDRFLAAYVTAAY